MPKQLAPTALRHTVSCNKMLQTPSWHKNLTVIVHGQCPISRRKLYDSISIPSVLSEEIVAMNRKASVRKGLQVDPLHTTDTLRSRGVSQCSLGDLSKLHRDPWNDKTFTKKKFLRFSQYKKGRRKVERQLEQRIAAWINHRASTQQQLHLRQWPLVQGGKDSLVLTPTLTPLMITGLPIKFSLCRNKKPVKEGRTYQS